MRNTILSTTVLLIALLGLSVQAQTKHPPYGGTKTHRVTNPYVPSDLDTRWANHNGPWDFSGMLGLYNPGFGLEGLAAYRIVDNLIPNIDDSLSVESGLGYISVNDSVAGTNVSYSTFEVPIMGRWDFRLNDSRIIVGPRAGFTYLSGGTVTIGGTSYSVRGGGLYLQIGGFGIFRFNDQWAGRAGIAVGGYTTLTLGVTYFL